MVKCTAFVTYWQRIRPKNHYEKGSLLIYARTKIYLLPIGINNGFLYMLVIQCIERVVNTTIKAIYCLSLNLF